MEEGLYSRKQIFSLPRPRIVDERSCPEVGGGVLSCVKKGKHVCKNFQLQLNSFRGHLGCVGPEMCSTSLDPCLCSGFPPLLVYGRGALPYPFKSARAVDFDFSQWFARIIFSCDFLVYVKSWFRWIWSLN